MPHHRANVRNDPQTVPCENYHPMTAFSQALRRVYRRRITHPAAGSTVPGFAPPVDPTVHVEIAESDRILPFLQAAEGAVALQALELDYATLRDRWAAGVRLVVPLVTHRELIGTLNLGPCQPR